MSSSSNRFPFAPHNYHTFSFVSYFFFHAVPTQQYRNLFGNNNNNNNNHKSHSPAKSTSSTSSKSKSQSPRKSKSAGEISKKQKPTAATSAAAGPAKPKTLEQALRQITPDDFAAQVAQVKISCPGSELRWLSSVSEEIRDKPKKDLSTFPLSACSY